MKSMTTPLQESTARKWSRILKWSSENGFSITARSAKGWEIQRHHGEYRSLHQGASISPVHLALPISTAIGGAISRAVSYTHLDVYKRQVMPRLCSPVEAYHRVRRPAAAQRIGKQALAAIAEAKTQQ